MSLILGIIILVGTGIIAHQYISQKAYQQGIQDATLLINQQILNSLNQNGYVHYIYTINNQTFNIRLIPQLPQNG